MRSAALAVDGLRSAPADAPGARRACVLLALLAAAVLAGCSGSGKAPAATLQATPTTGILRGVVVDEAIRPLEGARVTVPLAAGGDVNATTKADGAFAFDQLPPGGYVVRVHKTAFLDIA